MPDVRQASTSGTVINGKVYERKEKQSSVLYDSFNGAWEVREMQDCPAQITGKIE